MNTSEGIDRAIARIDEKLEDGSLAGHAFARLMASRAQFEKLRAAQSQADDKPSQTLGPALAALPPEHASKILSEEIERLEKLLASYRELQVELEPEEAFA